MCVVDCWYKFHVVMDSEEARRVKEDIVRVPEQSSRENLSEIEREEVHEGDGCSPVACDFITYSYCGAWDDALESIDGLGNGSYGALIVINEEEIYKPEVHGDAKLVVVDDPDRSTKWYGGGSFYFDVRMAASEWAEVVGCDLESLDDKIDEVDSGLLREIVPGEILDSFVRLGSRESISDEYFGYHDTDSYKEEGEAYEADEKVTVSFYLSFYKITLGELEELADMLKRAAENPSRPGVEIRLSANTGEVRRSAGEYTEIYDNSMADLDAFSYLEFASTWGSISDVKVCTVVPK